LTFLAILYLSYRQSSNIKMSFDAETAGNFEEIEMQFAVKTVEHLEVSLVQENTFDSRANG